MSDHWGRREERFDARPVSTGILGIGAAGLWVLAIVIVIGLISVLLWAFGVFTSGVKGAGDAEVIKNSAANRIRAQEGFESRWQGILTADRNLTITAVQLSADPTSTKLWTELTGQQMICNSAVGDYNARARSFTSADFRAADLPHQIDSSDSQTDCKG